MNSVFEDDHENICFECGRYGVTHQHHILEGSSRLNSEKRGLKVHLCLQCHEMVHHAKGKKMREEYHKMAQVKYEEMRMAEGMTAEQARAEFRKEFIRSYL